MKTSLILILLFNLDLISQIYVTEEADYENKLRAEFGLNVVKGRSFSDYTVISPANPLAGNESSLYSFHTQVEDVPRLGMYKAFVKNLYFKMKSIGRRYTPYSIVVAKDDTKGATGVILGNLLAGPTGEVVHEGFHGMDIRGNDIIIGDNSIELLIEKLQKEPFENSYEAEYKRMRDRAVRKTIVDKMNSFRKKGIKIKSNMVRDTGGPFEDFKESYISYFDQEKLLEGLINLENNLDPKKKEYFLVDEIIPCALEQRKYSDSGASLFNLYNFFKDKTKKLNKEDEVEKALLELNGIKGHNKVLNYFLAQVKSKNIPAIKRSANWLSAAAFDQAFEFVKEEFNKIQAEGQKNKDDLRKIQEIKNFLEDMKNKSLSLHFIDFKKCKGRECPL